MIKVTPTRSARAAQAAVHGHDHVHAQVLSRADMVVELRLRLGGRSMRRCGAEWGVDFHEISAVLANKRYPGARLLGVLGLREERTVMYVRIADSSVGGSVGGAKK